MKSRIKLVLKTKKLVRPSGVAARQAGFTLIELLVALVITALMLTLVLASYWTFLQTERKMNISRELQSEVRFALNRITDKVRSSQIDYDAYQLGESCGPSHNQNFRLCLLDADDITTYFFLYDDANGTLSMGRDESNTQPLISQNLFRVNALQFEYSPGANPAVLSNPQLQPKVTVSLNVATTNGMFPDIAIENQTTISSRHY